MKGTPLDLIGEKFDRLTVIGKACTTKSGSVWVCLCDCGEIILKLTSSLRRKNMKHIGCKSCSRNTRARSIVKNYGTRNYKKRKLYGIWKGMRSRCRDKGNTSYKYYGGKGIKVCEEWNDYKVFRSWALLNGYKNGMSIDRLDSFRDYEPSNCQILTKSENSKRIKKLLN